MEKGGGGRGELLLFIISLLATLHTLKREYELLYQKQSIFNHVNYLYSFYNAVLAFLHV